MNIIISTHDRDLAGDIKGDAAFDLTVSGLVRKGRKSFGDSPLYEFTIFVAGLGKDVAVGLFSAWLYNKIKGRSQSITADGKQARIEVIEIERCIEIKVKETHRRTEEE